MRRLPPRSAALCLLAFCLLLSACSGQTAAQGVVANPDLAATAQMDQYRRDAQATQSARDAEIERITLEIQITAQAATSTAQVVGVTQTSVAQAQATRAADDATSTHVARLDATSTTAAQIASVKTATAEANAAATGTAVVIGTQTTIRLNTEQAEAARLRIQTWLTMLGLALLVIAIAAVCIWLAIIAGRNWRKHGHLQRYGPNGNPLLLVEGRDGRVIVHDPLASPTPGLTVTPDGKLVPMLGFTAQDQLHAALARLYLLALQATHNPFPPVLGQPEHETKWKAGPVSHETRTGSLPSSIREPSTFHLPPSTPLIAAPMDEPLPAEAPWHVLDQWRGGALPIGLGARGLLTADPERDPHLVISGATGSGKTRYAVRPIVAAALADGWQVVVITRPHPGYQVFEHHPNAALCWLDEPEQAIALIEAAHAEIQHRIQYLTDVGADTWSRLPASGRPPRQLVVVEETSNLLDDLAPADRERLWASLRASTREGRKAGFHFGIVLHDLAGPGIDPRARRQCSPVVFAMRGQGAGRVVLQGYSADGLPPRQFLAVMNHVVHRGIAFAPEDDQIAELLRSRPVTPHGPPEWLSLHIPASVVEDRLQTAEPDPIAALADKIRPAWVRGESKRGIARSIGKEYGGAWAGRIDAAIQRLEAATTPATTAHIAPEAA